MGVTRCVSPEVGGGERPPDRDAGVSGMQGTRNSRGCPHVSLAAADSVLTPRAPLLLFWGSLFSKTMWQLIRGLSFTPGAGCGVTDASRSEDRRFESPPYNVRHVSGSRSLRFSSPLLSWGDERLTPFSLETSRAPPPTPEQQSWGRGGLEHRGPEGVPQSGFCEEEGKAPKPSSSSPWTSCSRIPGGLTASRDRLLFLPRGCVMQ